MVAYYCFVNLGWTPSQYTALSLRERSLITEFVNKDIEKRLKEQEEIKRKAGSKRKR